jgi:hypothetical protein
VKRRRLLVQGGATRRRLLQLGAGSAALLLLAGGAALLHQPALESGKLTPAGRQSMGALARVVLDGALPEDPAALERHLSAFETAVAALPPVVRAELAQLLALCTITLGRWLLMGEAGDFSQLARQVPRTQLAQALQGLRLSKLALRRQAYFALRDLHCAAFYAENAAWPLMGYPGPTQI